MSFVQPQRNPLRLSVGIGVAIVFHIALVWALINGLAHKVMQTISAPIETRLIEEVKPPPPPPKPVQLELPPPPKFAPPPPPVYVPPPEVQVPNPPPTETIAATTIAPPPPAPVASRIEAPKPSPSPAAGPVAPPAPPAPPAPISAGVACSNFKSVMGEAAFPRAAQRMGLESGEALIQFTLGAGGEIKDVKAISATNPVFAENSIRIVKEFTCAGRGADVTVRVPFTYKSE